MGADDKLYGAGHRFHSAQIGLAIPIFAKSQKEKIKASQIAEEVSRSDYDSRQAMLQNRYDQLLSAYNSHKEIVEYYQSNSLTNARLIAETANKQFINGEINYLDYVMIINQSINIQNNYLEALRALNESITEINYLQSN